MKNFKIQKSEFNSELHIFKKYAEIFEVKNPDHDNENMIRIFQSSGSAFSFQIRTHKGIGVHGSGKKRNMIANVSMTVEELKEILNFIEENYEF